MPPVTQILGMRERRRALQRRNPAGKIALLVCGLVGMVAALLAISIALVYTNFTSGLPPVEALPPLLEPPDGLFRQPTRLYDRSGEQVILTLQNPAAADQQYLKVSAQPTSETNLASSDISPYELISATLAASDPGFWAHPGCTPASLRLGAPPTLAQRLASRYLLSGEPAGLRSSIRQCLLAIQITDRFGRERTILCVRPYRHSGDQPRTH